MSSWVVHITESQDSLRLKTLWSDPNWQFRSSFTRTSTEPSLLTGTVCFHSCWLVSRFDIRLHVSGRLIGSWREKKFPTKPIRWFESLSTSDADPNTILDLADVLSDIGSGLTELKGNVGAWWTVSYYNLWALSVQWYHLLTYQNKTIMWAENVRAEIPH